jgi:hypothetical protein
MPNYTSTYLDQEKRSLDQGLPVISTELDSVRTYGWEVDFNLPPGFRLGGKSVNATKRSLTLGAKSISEFGFNFQDIEVNRLNDKAYYPGKVTNDEITITFDNLLRAGGEEYTTEGQMLLDYMGIVYSQNIGRSTTIDYKQTLRIKEFDTAGNVRAIYELIGAYPKQFKKAEKNYATGNEFDTVQMTFRFDFIRVLKGNSSPLGGLINNLLDSIGL